MAVIHKVLRSNVKTDVGHILYVSTSSLNLRVCLRMTRANLQFDFLCNAQILNEV